MTAAAHDVKACIVAALRQSLADAGVDTESLPDDFDLRASGVIDSLGFIQLIALLHDRFGCRIDLADVDPTELTNVDVLCSHIAAQVARHDAR
jgi:acyl carrier protein